MVVFIFAIVVVLAIAAVSVITILRRRERRPTYLHGPIPLMIPLPPSLPATDPWPPASTQLTGQPSRLGEAAARARGVSIPGRMEADAFLATGSEPQADASLATDPEPEVDAFLGAGSEPEATPTVRFRRPTDDAVQLLPGRLEVIAGESHHKEIRFVRTPGERPEIIVGRDGGDGPGHVALHSPTVSRRHARFAYENREWKVANLSQTNPLVVNDETLLAGQGERLLADGDRLELGEVVLRFHAGNK